MVTHMASWEKGLDRRVQVALRAVSRDSFTAAATAQAVHPQGTLFELAAVEPGMHVLVSDFSGGYTAALAREIVGDRGSVTVLAVDDGSAREVRSCLRRAGYEDIRVAAGQVGEEDFFDRIIASAPMDDIPAGWLKHLATAGQIVIPQILRDLVRLVAWEREGDDLVSRDHRPWGYYLPAGPGPAAEDGAGDQWRAFPADHDGAVDADTFLHALNERPTLILGNGKYRRNADLDLYLLTASDDTVMAWRTDRHGGAVAKGIPMLSEAGSFACPWAPGVLDGRVPEDGRYGVAGYGDRAAALVGRLSDMIRRWSAYHAVGGTAHLRYTPGTHQPKPELPGIVLRKPGGSVSVSWAWKPDPEDLGVNLDALEWTESGTADGAILIAFPEKPGAWERGDWVLMRVAGDAEGRTLLFDRNEWECFIDGVLKNEFDDAATAI